jgi:hypothetical protein
MYQIELTQFGQKFETSIRDFFSSDGAQAALSSLDADVCVVFVAHLVDNCDYGNFHVWMSAEHALVRLDEHRAHFASFRR